MVGGRWRDRCGSNMPALDTMLGVVALEPPHLHTRGTLEKAMKHFTPLLTDGSERWQEPMIASIRASSFHALMLAELVHSDFSFSKAALGPPTLALRRNPEGSSMEATSPSLKT